MKLRSVLCLIFSILLLTVTGCSTSNRSVTGGELDGTAGLTEEDLNLAREQRFGDSDIPLAGEEGMFRDIRFGYDSSSLSDEARQNIEYNVQLLEQNDQVKVQLEGHCDERGTTEYNTALGNLRAEAVKEMLVAYGVQPSRLSVISYGEDVPLDQGRTEEAYARNRRVHFSAFTR